ncbi:amidase family protein [Actinomycetospora soli]|uniref:amidase family protein n=1 Tax=Actinomycetospora soli TaxID=2893887 RepID=UPI001E481825|nr:amidase [Actinomycetospora soli]MCD2190542.1 amidase [Actinomycetospora soli]
MTAPWSLRALVGELADGTTTPAAALARADAAIAATEPEVQAWVARSDPASGTAGPLGGVPLGVKDIIDLAGLPTRCGSVLRADAPPAAADAAIVARWRALGAVPIGKTVTTEFAFFAPGPTNNPAAPGHTPGGSSSGSAAAVAAGHVPLALGSQTAGSVTRPAAFCGVAALVLTHGRLPVDGVTGLAESLDSHGVFAATVSDLSLAVAALLDGDDPAPVGPPRLAVWRASPLEVVEPVMAAALDGAVARLRAAGAEVVEFDAEDLVAAVAADHPVVMAYEAARERAVEHRHPEALSEPLRSLLDTGAATPRADHEAARERVAAARATLLAHLDVDAILGPGAPGPAPAGLGATGNPVLSRPWQALGLPQLSVPGLRDDDGRPLGLQLIGRPDAELALLGAGRWVEAGLS